MYIQITTRCNMRCGHCCYSCGPRGRDMSFETFENALKIAEDYGEHVTIGGGEPTVHPLFWQMLGAALGSDVEGVWLATNGKRTRDAITLAALAKGSERFAVALSLDDWHEPTDPSVKKAFEDAKQEIRRVGFGHPLSNAGRAKENGLWTDETCACGGLFVTPTGRIKPCGCRLSPDIGTVDEPFERPSWMYESEYEDSECWSDYKRKVKANKGG